MNRAFIVGRPSLDLSLLRQTVQAVLGRDLTTNTKGSSEPLSCLSLLISDDEYGMSIHAKGMLEYVILLLSDVWTLDNLQNLFGSRLTAYVIETKKQDVRLAFVKGSLQDFEFFIKTYSTPKSSSDILEALNSIQVAFEAEGLGRIFNDYSKEKMDNVFFLEKK